MKGKSEFVLNAKRRGIALQLKRFPMLKASYVKSLINRKEKIEGELVKIRREKREFTSHQERFLKTIMGI